MAKARLAAREITSRQKEITSRQNKNTPGKSNSHGKTYRLVAKRITSRPTSPLVFFILSRDCCGPPHCIRVISKTIFCQKLTWQDKLQALERNATFTLSPQLKLLLGSSVKNATSTSRIIFKANKVSIYLPCPKAPQR